MIDKNLKRQDLRELGGLSGESLTKLIRSKSVTTGVLVRICQAMNPQLHEAVETAFRELPAP